VRPRRLAAAVLAASAVLLPCLPARAAGNIPVTDNGGVLIAHGTVHAGEVLARGGTAYRVVMARCASGSCVIRLSPGLPRGDEGQSLVFAAR
jgi:hypothetical protein